MKTFTTYEPVKGMKFCRKKPITVKALQMNESFEVITLEGKMHGNAGDYLICGINHELYPCAKDIFEKTYEWH